MTSIAVTTRALRRHHKREAQMLRRSREIFTANIAPQSHRRAVKSGVLGERG